MLMIPSVWLAASFGCLIWILPTVCHAAPQNALCRSGEGTFNAESRNGIKVHVGAARNGKLATRACAARLSWDNQELEVATSVSQLDLDIFGTQLEDGLSIAAFQVKTADSDCCMEYRVYSLEKPPRLLRKIEGGDFFSASDVDMDGRVEIWTRDAAALKGFERLSPEEFDAAPTVVFRFAKDRLVDVSSEFRLHYDREIAALRAEIQPRDLQEFKNSDGQLKADASTPIETAHRLRAVKIKIIEIVWAYLYSGREQEAWSSLAEMWPPSDTDRIRGSLLSARAAGIHGQADETSTITSLPRKKSVQIFNAVSKPGAGSALDVSPPQPIFLWRPPAAEIQQPGSADSEALLNLVIDVAGKVRSSEWASKTGKPDPELIDAALAWKFIPAFKNNRPVACRLRTAVSMRR